MIKKDKEKTRAVGDMENQQTECTYHKCFRCGSVDHLIAKCLEPPRDTEIWRNQFRFNDRVNCASQKECENGRDDTNQYIYSFMARMSGNDRMFSRDFGESLQ